MRQQTVGGITFLISLALFFIVSHLAAQWYVYHQMGFDNHFRFTDGAHVNGEILDLYVEYITGQKGYKIAVIGDSVVQGAGVPERDRTITAYLQDELRGSYLKEARVFNFGLPGGRPADLFMAVKKLHEAGAAQLVIVNISYPFFSDEMAQIPILYDKVWYPCLTGEEKEELNVYSAEPEEEEVPEAGSSPEIEDMIRKKVSECWSVYRFRQELNRFLFGGQPPVRGKECFDYALYGTEPGAEQPLKSGREKPLSEKDKPENKYKVWNSFPWSDQDLAHLKKVFNVAGWNNINFKYYLEICRHLEENKIPALIFISPVNHALLQRYNLIDYDSYRENTVVIMQAASRSGIPFLNYQEAVSPELFHDSMHMLDGGNAVTAKLLSRDLQPLIQGEEVK